MGGPEIYFLLPLKKTKGTDVANVLYNSVALQHNEQAAAKSMPGCKAVQKYRGEVVKVTELGEQRATEEGLAVLQAYHRSLECVETRLEITNNNQLSFTWTDPVSEKDRTTSNIHAEKSGVVFDLANLEARLAGNLPGETMMDYLKAVRRFCTAAGYFQHVAQRKLIGDSVGPDLDYKSLEFFSALMLVNGQVAFLEGAKAGNKGADVLAGLAMGVAKLIGSASQKLRQAPLQKFESDHWLSQLLSLWASYYTVVAHMHWAAHCDAESNMRDRLACLYSASEMNYEAAQLGGKMKATGVTGDLVQHLRTEISTQSTQVQRERASAEEENNMLEHTKASDSVPQIAPKISIAATEVDGLLREPVPEDVIVHFNHLVPKAAAMASKSYMLQVENIVEGEATKMERSRSSIGSARADLVRSWEPVAAAASAEAEAVATARALAAEGDGVAGLTRKQGTVESMARDAWATLADAEQTLSAEAHEDSNARRDTKGALNRPHSAQLNRPFFESLERIRSELESARKADDTIRQKFSTGQGKLLLLEGISESQTRQANPEVEAQNADRVRVEEEASKTLKDLDELGAAMRAKQSAEASTLDNLPSDATERANFFERRLKDTYSALQQQSLELCHKADRLADEIRRMAANGPPGGRGGGAAEGSQDMEALQSAAKLWKEINSNWDMGLDFYSKELHILQRLQKDVRQFATARKAELNEHMSHLSAAFQKMEVGGRPPYGAPGYGPPPQDGGPPPPGAGHPGQPYNQPPPYGGGAYGPGGANPPGPPRGGYDPYRR